MSFDLDDGYLNSYTGNEKTVIVPEGVRSIGFRAFSGNDVVEHVILPESVKYIYTPAFENCRSLRSVKLPDSLEEFSPYAFQDCPNLKEITLPAKVRYIQGDFGDIQHVEIDPQNPYYMVVDGVIYEKESRELFAVPKGVGKCVTIPDGVTEIRFRVFEEQRNLEKIVLPASVQTIADSAFSGCRRLTDIVMLNVKKIGRFAFAGCASLAHITLPETLTEIGKGAFSECSHLQEIRIPADVSRIEDCTFAGCAALRDVKTENPDLTFGDAVFQDCENLRTDENGVIVRQGVLHYCDPSRQEIVIPEGVEEIAAGAVSARVRRIQLPDSVRMIKVNPWSHDTVINIPAGARQWTETFSWDAIEALLAADAWRQAMTDGDVASLLLFRASKEFPPERIQKALRERFDGDPDAVLRGMCEVLPGKGKSPHYQQAADYYFAHKTAVQQETVDALYAAAKSGRARKAKDLLAPYVTGGAEAGGSAKDASAAHPIEAFCREQFASKAMEQYLKKIGLKASVFAHVKYQDTGEEASPFVVQCAMVPYMQQLKQRPKRIGNYKTDYVKIDPDPTADQIAAALDPASLGEMLDNLLEWAVIVPEVLMPYGRFATGKQITELGKRLRGWAHWESYATKGRVAVIVAHGAILYNESSEALKLADKIGILGAAATIRNTTETDLRSAMLMETGLDASGKKQYDLGETTVEILLAPGAVVQIYDVGRKKIVRSLPKKGSDAEKLAAANADLSEMKKGIKQIVPNHVRQLVGSFTQGSTEAADRWKQTYLQNPVLCSLAQSIVWGAKPGRGAKAPKQPWTQEFNFTVSPDGTLVNAAGGRVELEDTTRISVLHPSDCEPEEVAAWKAYLDTHQIEQPFDQMYEPIYDCDVESLDDRYKDAMIPYRLIKEFAASEGRTIVKEFSSHFNISLGRATLYMVSESGPVPSDSSEIKLLGLECPDEGINNSLNHKLYLLDSLCMKAAIREDDRDSLSRWSECLHEKNIFEMMAAAERAGSSSCCSWLQQYQEKNFPNAVK